MFFLALRHLSSRKRQTLLTLLGILLGTAAYVTISGMMLGFQVFIIDQLVNNDAHVRISAREEILTQESLRGAYWNNDTIVNWLKTPSGRKDNPYILAPFTWLVRLNNDARVAAASPQLVSQAIATHGKVTASARLIGSMPEKQTKVSNIESHMLQGKFQDIGNSGSRIAIGDGLMKILGAAMNESILLSVGKGVPQPFKIVGVFNLGIKTLDDSSIFGALTDVQKLNNTPSRVSDIAVRLSDVTMASSLASTWNLLGQEKVQSWDQSNEGIMSVFKTQDIIRNFMTISILIVAGFGIYNILSLAVNHKRREIAILRSMGFEPRDITELFLTQGVLLGVVGGICGCIVGLIACFLISKIEVSASRGLGANHMFVSFSGFIYMRAFLLAFLASSFAGYLPARAAGKLEPIDIIRSENN